MVLLPLLLFLPLLINRYCCCWCGSNWFCCWRRFCCAEAWLQRREAPRTLTNLLGNCFSRMYTVCAVVS